MESSSFSSSRSSAKIREHRVSIENTMLTEVITIYEKMKKGRENRVLRRASAIEKVAGSKRVRFNTTIHLN